MVFRIHLLSLYILLCLSLLCDVNSSTTQGFKQPGNVGFAWGNCGPPGQPVQILSLSIGPDPLKLPGNVLISASINLTIPFPSDFSSIVVMEKNVAGFYIKIPCEGNVGSCTYRDICRNGFELEPMLAGINATSKPCPAIPPATYSVSNLMLTVSKSIPSIADGGFRITVDFLSNVAGQLGCVQFYITLQ